MSNSQSEDVLAIDSQEYNRLYKKLLKNHEDKLRLIEQSERADEKNKMSKKNKRNKDDSDQDSRNRRRPRGVDRDRSRSRQKPQQQINWHIYEEIPSIDYIDELPQKLRHLPIFKKKDEILQKIIKNQIVLVTGDTGCGKSTQVPRLIYQYLKKINSTDKIICVQPRRLAVTSLKSAVQGQLPHSQRVVGYQIGQKAQFNSNSRIVFMTNGIFLQRIIHDTTFLNEYPFVVLDQVHERDIDTDFILTAIKRIIRQYPKVRIVLMSATIDNELFRYYFASDHIDTFMSEDNFYKKIIEMEEYEKIRDQEDSQEQEGFGNRQQDSEEQQEKKRKIYDNVAFKFLESKFPCPGVNINEPSNFKRKYFYLDTLDDFVRRQYVKKWGSIIWSHKHANTYKELFQMGAIIIDQIRYNSRQKNDVSSEAVLVFLPGLNEIQNFSESLFAFLGGREKVHEHFQLVHVHSTIMTEKVEEKINTPNKRQIKVIISTNIAESSITVRGVKYVIDFCLTKEIRFDEKSKMENLQLVWSSKASCKQRAGRTGRVCDGYIFRLVEEKFYLDKFEDYSEPQIKRSSLDKLILRIKMMHQNDKSDLFRDPPEVLGTCIQPPRLESIQSAINSLKFCGGLQQRGDEFLITDLGKLYVELPIDISYTKLLIISIMFGTFNDILIVVAILSQNKSPIHKRQVQSNPLKYLNEVSNYEYCDFLALVNMFKNQEEFRRQIKNTKQQEDRPYKRQKKGQNEYIREQNRKRDRLAFSIYNQTRNTMDDIMKRMQRRWFNFGQLSGYLDYRNGEDIRKLSTKCQQQKPTRQKYTDYYMRFKMTLAFGFVDKLILIKTPMYDNKQQKRIRDMKRFDISNQNTIVLLNSSVITKLSNHNKQAEQKFIRHWQDVFRKSLNINIKNITITAGLNYLHFEDELDLNKLSFIKYMDTNSKKRSSACILQDPSKKQHKQQEKPSAYLTTRQILQSLGDLDHMQEGIPVTLFKQNRIIMDGSSVNRICNLNQHAPDKYLVTNSFMLQNRNSLSCRYTSALNIFSLDSKKIPNTILPVLINLLFYPFVKLKANKKQTQYQCLALKKKYNIKIPYNLTSQQIQQANFIRQLIKEFLSLKRTLTSQNCTDFYQLIKRFICRKRKDIVHAKDQQIWQNQFLNELKDGKIPNIEELKNIDNFKKSKNQLKQLKKDIITEQAQQQDNNLHKDPNTMTFQQLRNTLKQQAPSFETRNFMNPIQLPKISAETSYFLRPRNQSAQHFKKRMEFYLKWKVGKLNQVLEMTKYALDNDTYLCCGYKAQDSNQCCSVPLCKLKRVGALDEQEIFRDLFEPIVINVVESTEEGSQVDDFLYVQNFQSQYTKFSCKNGHEIGFRLKSQSKIKILINKQYSLKFPDYPYSPIKQVEFSSLDMKDWAKQQRQSIDKKQRKLFSTSCYLCANQISTFKQLKNHFQDPYHMQTVEKFKKSIQSTKIQLQNESKVQQIEEQDEQANKIQLEKLKSLKIKKVKEDEAMEIQY